MASGLELLPVEDVLLPHTKRLEGLEASKLSTFNPTAQTPTHAQNAIMLQATKRQEGLEASELFGFQPYLTYPNPTSPAVTSRLLAGGEHAAAAQ